MSRNGVVLGVMLLLAAAAGCFGREASDDPAQTTATPATGLKPDAGLNDRFDLREVASGLDSPVHLTHAGDGTGRIFLVEQEGVVKVWKDGKVIATPFLDIQDKVGCCGERGLLSIAFHPDHKTNRHVFVSYTDNNGDTVIARYTVRADDPDRADPNTAKTILTQDQPFANHNGGLITFGPDRLLYIGLGDGGSAGDPQGNGQNKNTFLGKILRIDVDRGDPYAVPPSNPFANGFLSKPEVWAYGLRNPWRFSFDAETGDLYIADVGQNSWEEVNHRPASSKGGENYGWNAYEGNHAFAGGITLESATFPVAEYARDRPHCSVTGGHVYRGDAIPGLKGVYVFGDYCSGQLFALQKQRDRWELSHLRDTGHSISSFGEDEHHELYLVDHTGRALKFVPR